MIYEKGATHKPRETEADIGESDIQHLINKVKENFD